MFPKLTKFDVLDDVFNDSFFTKRESTIMKTDIIEKGNDYILKIDLPGYKKEDIKLQLNDGYLTISASTENIKDDSDEKENYIHKERFYGKCSRSFYVGDIEQEQINASFKDGILKITFPKENTKIEKENKYIEIGD